MWHRHVRAHRQLPGHTCMQGTRKAKEKTCPDPSIRRVSTQVLGNSPCLLLLPSFSASSQWEAVSTPQNVKKRSAGGGGGMCGGEGEVGRRQ